MADRDFVVKNGLVTGSNTLTVGTALTVNTTGVYRSSTLIANNTGPYGKSEGNLNVNSASYSTSAGSATNATYSTSAGSATNATYSTSAGSATNASAATNATYATSAGSATNATSAGSATNATYATSAGSATNATYAASAGSAGTFSSTSQNSQFGSIGVGMAAQGSSTIYAIGDIVGGYSDERLKTNVKPIENALEKIKAISGVTYTSNELAASFGYTDMNEQVGLLAHEIESVLPQVVRLAPFDVETVNGIQKSKSGENYKTVQYERIIPLLIEAIKQLEAEVAELRNKV